MYNKNDIRYDNDITLIITDTLICCKNSLSKKKFMLWKNIKHYLWIKEGVDKPKLIGHLLLTSK